MVTSNRKGAASQDDASSVTETDGGPARDDIDGNITKSNADGKQSNVPAAVWELLLVCSVVAMMFAASYRAMMWVTLPLGLDAPAQLFSEARALSTAADLSEGIGIRLVSTPEVETAAQYVLERALALQEQAALTRPDLIVEVDREQTSGGVNMVFVGTPITNAYRNLTNVSLRIAPKVAAHVKAVLVNAHFDSVFGTTGASDCAACVGTALELARVIVADPGLVLAAPVLFLLNGGEETVLTAAHGFMAGSKWAPNLGAFINLESTGPGGPDILFQHTGSWTVDAYARGAKRPHGSVFAQDFFETRALSMDTDFRMFSGDYLGRLPGIDIAQVLDGAAYHSKHDTIERIRRGTIQMLGENVLGALLEFARALQRQDTQPLPAHDAEGSVYFDILSMFMVTYPKRLGRILHSIPLLLVLAAACLRLPRAKSSGNAPGRLAAVAQGAGLWIAAVAACFALPASIGAARAYLTGKPIIWFGCNALAAAIYAPAALAGLLLPYAAFPFTAAARDIDAAVLGVAAVRGLEAAALTFLGAKCGFAFAVWGATGAASVLAPARWSRGARLAWALCSCVPALLCVLPVATTLPQFVLEHISTGGGSSSPLGDQTADVAVGVVFGAVAALVLSCLVPWIAHVSRPFLGAFTGALLLGSAVASGWASRAEVPYSDAFPKRILVQHLHILATDGRVQESRWVVGTLDVAPVETALPPGSQLIPSRDRDWQALYPVTNLMRSVALHAPPPPEGGLFRRKRLRVRLSYAEGRGGGLNRLHMVMQLPRPGWGVLNVTGPIVGWSFAEEVPKATERVTRFAGNAGSDNWPFWLDVEGRVRVEVSVMLHQQTPQLEEFARGLPEWATLALSTTFQRGFDF